MGTGSQDIRLSKATIPALWWPARWDSPAKHTLSGWDSPAKHTLGLKKPHFTTQTSQGLVFSAISSTDILQEFPKCLNDAPSQQHCPLGMTSPQVFLKTSNKPPHCLRTWGPAKSKLLCTRFCTAKARPLSKTWATSHAVLDFYEILVTPCITFGRITVLLGLLANLN